MSSRFHLVSLLLSCLFLCPLARAQQPAPTHDSGMTGLWLTEDKEGVVKIYQCGKALCGMLYWLKPSTTADAAIDDKNPDPKLRTRPLCGMEFMGGFAEQPDGSYSNGWIYSPRHGATFGAAISNGEDDTLDVRGYFVLPLLGETQTWTRAHTIQPCVSLPEK